MKRPKHHIRAMAIGALVSVAGCGPAFVNQTASLGGSAAGSRGRLHVVLLNNTPHRAVFTFGSLNQTDRAAPPDFGQFGLDPFGPTLNGGESSGIGRLGCDRMFSVGGTRLIERIEPDGPDGPIAEEALIVGVDFFEEAPEADDVEPQFVGRAPPQDFFLGLDYACGSLLIVRLEFDDFGPDPFRIDFEIVPSESAR